MSIWQRRHPDEINFSDTMKKIITLMLFLTFFAHANDSEPGSQYLKAAEAGDRRAQYFLADSWFSSGDLSKGGRSRSQQTYKKGHPTPIYRYSTSNPDS